MPEEGLEYESPLLTELQEKVLIGIISCFNNVEELSSRMAFVQTRVIDEYMQGTFWRLWKVVSTYYLKTGGIPSPESFQEIIQSVSVIDLPEKLRLSDSYTTFAYSDIPL